jgi:hypothetical protein
MLCILMHRGRKTSTHYFPCSGGHCVISRKSTPARYTELLFFASGGIYESRSAFRYVRHMQRCALFYTLGWARYGFHKNHSRTRCAEHVVLHLVGSVGHVVHSGASGPRNVEALFFSLRWARSNFHNKHTLTRYADLVILHPMRFVGHVVHFGAEGEENVDALFSMLGWTLCEFPKKQTVTRYTELLFFFASGGIYGSCSAFWSSGTCNVMHYFPGWARCDFHKKHSETRYVELMVLHLVGSVGHVVLFSEPAP